MRKLILVGFIALSLAACRDGGKTEEAATEAPQAAATSEAATPAAPAVVSEFKQPFPVATLPFRFHVAIDREVRNKKTGVMSREVGIEFLESSAADVDKSFADALQAAGYTRASNEAQGRAFRSVFTKAGEGDILVWVRPGAPKGDRYAIQQPDAKGTIYLAWPVTPAN
jgi:hypothetical protein